MANLQRSKNRRVNIIKTVTTPLGFFVLIVLVVEVIFGAVAGSSVGLAAAITVTGMLLVILSLIAVVTYLAYSRPEALFGTRPPADAVVRQQLHSFCQHVAGHWWTFGADPDSVGFATIEPDETTSTLIVSGRTYAQDGKLVARWNTTASSISLKRKMLDYIWQGQHYDWDEQPSWMTSEWYDGYGEISFHDSTDRFDTGIGRFFDKSLTDVTSIIRKQSTWERCSEEEVGVMQRSDKQGIGRLVQKKLKGRSKEG